jgi:peptide deformylase
MAILKILTIPDPILRQKAEPVAKVDAETAQLMRNMLETMYVGGIGLAANQVGVLKRIVTVDISDERDGSKALLMANPEIIWSSDEKFTYKEGCLSVPDSFADVVRPKKIRVKYLNEKNEPKEVEAEDLLSVCIQHEIDHLNGILFIDHLSRLKRNMIVKKVEKTCSRQDQ